VIVFRSFLSVLEDLNQEDNGECSFPLFETVEVDRVLGFDELLEGFALSGKQLRQELRLRITVEESDHPIGT